MQNVKITTNEGRSGHQGFYHAARRAAGRNVPLVYLTGLYTPARGETKKFRQTVSLFRRADFGDGEPPRQLTNAQRLYAHKRAISLAEIARRRLTVPPGWDEGELNFRVEDCHSLDRLWLLVARGFHRYGRHIRETAANYLCGYDEKQLFAVRVQSTITSVAEAEEWLMPTPVRVARDRGDPVRRQGDFYFAPPRARARYDESDFSVLVRTEHSAHARKNGGYTVVHPQHRALRLSGKYAWVAYPARPIRGKRSCGD